MRFQDIKVGDKVVVPKYVRYGWNSGKTFRIVANVTRVTKTQFTADGRRFKKDYGSEIGESFSYATKYRDESQDQTSEMNLFIQKVKDEKYIKNTITSITQDICKRKLHELDMSDIDTLKARVNSIKNLLA